MKRLISILAALILLSAVPGPAWAAPPDWTPVQIPAPESDTPPVCFDIDGYSADIALDANDNLYVMSGPRVIRFNPEGKVDTSWGKDGVMYDGELETSNSEMQGIAADGRGYVYALCRILEDGSPTFIKRYTSGGETDKLWYGDGIMGGKFAGEDFAADEAEPEGGVSGADEIAIGSEDNLYVFYDRQVYKFLPDGTPDEKWRRVEMNQPEEAYGGGAPFSNAMSIDRDDNVYLFNGDSRTVSKYSRTGRSLKKQSCPLYYSYEDGFGETKYSINKVALGSDGNIYNINPDGDSISKYSPKMRLDKGWCENGIFSVGKDLEPVRTITDFETDAAGGIYILDGENKAVCKYKNDGSLDTGWGTNGSIGSVNGDGRAALSITDIVSDAGGSIYALSGRSSDGNAIITRVNPDFTLNDKWGPAVSGGFKGYKTDAFSSMAVYNGNLYIEPNTDNAGVGYNGMIMLDENGLKDPEWKITSTGPVWDIETDGSGGIYAAGERITKYLPDGSVDKNWGNDGSVAGVDITGEMAVDSGGFLYVSDRGNDCIIRYTPEGHLDYRWGEAGKAYIPGADKDSALYYSYFIAIDSAGNLYLSDYINNRILRYNNSGDIDASWCDGGEWKSSDNISEKIAPMIHPTHLMIRGGRLYAIWNNKLYVMNDFIARIGVKPPQAPRDVQASEEAAGPGTFPLWKWAVCIGGLLFCAGAITAMILLLPKKKKNKRQRMKKIKSIKIEKNLKLKP